ncbi:YdeI/OmpD-associated family protein [Cryobacterium tagatosivorans]|uniref:YdeI/OmpD-associated family protein n=1 Tax=Cryobacterium tagatosivorans TaxID=1259199 RepID=UPI003B96F8FE
MAGARSRPCRPRRASSCCTGFASAKRPATRQKRITEVVAAAAEGRPVRPATAGG